MDLHADQISFVKNAVGADFEIFRLAGDASTRRYYRIVSDSASWALMSWEPFANEKDYPFLNVLHHFKESGILVPQVFAVDGTKGLVLLEDLGDLTLERKFWENQDQSQSLPFYKKSVDQLVKIHTAATLPKNPKPVCQQVEFNFDKFLWELNYTKTHLLEGLCQLKLSPQTEAALEKAFTVLADSLASEPKVVCHRDYHSRNVMLKLGRTYVIDFQDARLGPRQYDLVSLLYDSYVDLGEEMKSLLLDHYISQLPESERKSCETQQFSDVFNLQLVQRCFKACGSFASFYQTRKDTRYLKYVTPTLKTVCSEAALLPDVKIIADIINNEGLLERNYEEPCEP
jgi:aminoglycoside/choline kinase family phosphotransferase